MVNSSMQNPSDFSGKTILITGGLGFIGSNLAHRLVQLGARLTLVDSLIPEYGGNLFNIAGIEDQVRVNISDVRDRHSMKHLVRDQDILFNLAGQTSHIDSMHDPVNDLEINAKAQLYILEACRRYNPAIKIVFASTRQIYGKPEYLPVDEAHPPRPVDVNGVNKLTGEWHHLLYHDVYGLKTSVLRMTNTIGPRMRIKDERQTFLGVWIRQLLQGRPFEVWNGSQLRDFTYIDDAVEAFLLAAASDDANGKIFNLGGVEPISLRALAERLVEIYGKGDYVIKTFPPERKTIDIGDYYTNCDFIRNVLGWAPRVSLSEALGKTLNYYERHLSAYL